MDYCFAKVCERVSGFCSYLYNEHPGALAVTVIGVVTLYLYKKYQDKARRDRWNSAGKDVVVVHGIARASTCPNLSPFVLKVETYLRITGINYQFETEFVKGPKGKTPWITVNGEDVADSEIIVKFLNHKFGNDLSEQLSAEQKGIAKSMQVMCDEHLLWGVGWWRWFKDTPNTFSAMVKLPLYFRIFMKLGLPRRDIKNRLSAQGLGRHSDQEIINFITQDLEAVSNVIGTKPFLMGDKVCEADCAVFGCLTQFVYGMPGSPWEAMMRKEFKNLTDYVNRMKKEFYKDWDKLSKY